MKEKIELEYTLNTSPKVLFSRLSTPSGLSEWFADNVNLKGNIFTFVWEDSEQQAELVSMKENKSIRFKWIDDENSNNYFEFRINQDELAGGLALLVTDFIDEYEKEETAELWDSQIAALKRVLGL